MKILLTCLTLMMRGFKQFGVLAARSDIRVSHAERWISALGGFLGMMAVSLISGHVLSLPDAAWIIASIGSSAVLLFAAPHGPLSQPWPLIGGHTVSAMIGVACSRWISPPIFTSAAAVGLSIAAMYYLRCLHPPGGSTALTAVLGGGSIHELGFHFVLTPVLLNAAVILVAALCVNALAPGRRYPTGFMTSIGKSNAHHQGDARLADETATLSELINALKLAPEMGRVREKDLETLFAAANGRAKVLYETGNS